MKTTVSMALVCSVALFVPIMASASSLPTLKNSANNVVFASSTLGSMVQMQEQLALMKMQEKVLQQKIRILRSQKDMDKINKGAFLSIHAPLQVQSSGCFAGHCSATVTFGKEVFVVTPGETVNGYRFDVISAAGLQVYHAGKMRWVGVDGVEISNPSTGNANTGDISAANPSFSHTPFIPAQAIHSNVQPVLPGVRP